MAKLSAVVITYNESINIDELIENLSFADEIIVVDSFSTDDTLSKLKSHKQITVFQHAFESFPIQKNYALSKASHDWVLFIDADERVTDKFRDEVFQKMINNELAAYYSYFQYYFGDKPIRFSGFQTAKSFRLFKKSLCNYDETKPVHERLIVNGTTAVLSNKILHYSFRDYNHYKSKMTQYAILKAQELHKKGTSVNFLKKHLKPLYRFFNHYIMRLGILDGKIGYSISKLNAYEVTKRYQELEKLNQASLSKK